ncbi:MAG TPA: hypothetical protein VFO19_06295 [Vicinamibacterales bacterium]|nr:hypothetical protein [Vicinamibacterales bacterium]
MQPTELVLDLTPRARFDLIDVRARAAEVHGDALTGFQRCFYATGHTTAGYLPQSLAARLQERVGGLGPYLELFRTMFPEGAGYHHDKLELRHELAPEQRTVEPANADSHLAFIGAGLHSCAAYDARRVGPVYFVDLDGTYNDVPRRRQTTLVGYTREEEVARTTIRVPVSSHPIDAVNLKDARFGLYDQIADVIAAHGVTKGRVRLELPAGEQFASVTVNEYETLLMQHDLAEVLHNPLRFAAEKARHAWNDPLAVPGKALAYAQYDLVRAVNRLVDALGLQSSRVERIIARALEVPASRFLRMRRSVDLLVSDARTPGRGRVVEGTYQTPILVQWRPARQPERRLDIAVTRFL